MTNKSLAALKNLKHFNHLAPSLVISVTFFYYYNVRQIYDGLTLRYVNTCLQCYQDYLVALLSFSSLRQIHL